MDNQQAIDEALDQLEIENEVVIEENTKELVEEATEEVTEETEQAKATGNLPGYIDNVEDWVAAGKERRKAGRFRFSERRDEGIRG